MFEKFREEAKGKMRRLFDNRNVTVIVQGRDYFGEIIRKLIKNKIITNPEFNGIRLHNDSQATELLSEYLEQWGYNCDIDYHRTNPLSKQHPLMVNLSGLEIEVSVSLPDFNDKCSVITIRHKRSSDEKVEMFYQAVSGFADYYKAKHEKDDLILRLIQQQQPIPVNFSRSN